MEPIMHKVSILLMLGVILFVTNDANAIPAFARKYSMSCKTCHAPFPRLKAAGDDFAGDGFVFPDKETPRYYNDTGDSELSLIRDLPFAIRFEGYGQYRSDTEQELDLSTPWILKILSGGELTKDVAYYFYFFFNERGEVAGVEDAFLMFNELGGTDLDLYFGQFQASDPLFKRELRLTFEDYQVYRTTPGNSGINLTYDRGVMLTYGLASGTNFTGEILNGNGIGPAENRVYDNDKYKTFMGRVSQDVTGGLRIGAFGYWGKEGDNTPNEVTMVGPDASLGVQDKLELNVQYVWREDKKPTFSHFDRASEMNGGFCELLWTPLGDKSKWYGALLYNHVEVDYDPVITQYRSLSASVGHLLRTNIRIIGEYTNDMENVEHRGVLGFIAAF